MMLRFSPVVNQSIGIGPALAPLLGLARMLFYLIVVRLGSDLGVPRSVQIRDRDKVRSRTVYPAEDSAILAGYADCGGTQ
jgi:hypothetical protein